MAIAIIKGNNKISGPTIDFLASVKNKRWPIGEDGYYVIGNSRTVSNVDNDLYSEHVYTKYLCNNPRSSKACSTRSIVDFFPNGNTYPEMVVLFRTSSEGQSLFNNLKPAGHHDKYLNSENRITLKNVMLDAVVYARKSTYTHCSVFEDLVDSFKMLHSNRQHYVLIDLETPQNRDNTINRCTELITSYVPEYFKIASPTPGNENDCTGSNFVVSVLLNKNMSRLNYSAPGNISTVAKSKFFSNNIRDTCSSTREDAEFLSQSTESDILRAIELNMNSSLNTDVPEHISTISLENERRESITHLLEEGAFAPLETFTQVDNFTQSECSGSQVLNKTKNIRDWESLAYWQNNWKEFLQNYLRDQFDVRWLETHPDWKKWLIVIPNNDEPLNTHFKCRICSEYYSKFYGKPQSRPALATDDGWVLNPRSDQKRKNYEMFDEHESGKKGNKGSGNAQRSGRSVHAGIIDRLNSEESMRIRSGMETITKILNTTSEFKKYKATAAMLLTVYTEQKLNIPFLNHPVLVALQLINGIDLGEIHRSRFIAKTMTLFISKQMHKLLLVHLYKNQYPISLIIDSTTDKGSNHYMIMYLRSLESERNPQTNEITREYPIVYFYSLERINYDESAQGYMNTISQKFNSENTVVGKNFENIIKQNLIGFASDGANVMIGSNGGVSQKLTEYVERPIFTIHCLAHRLQLAVGRAWNEKSYFQKLEELTNSIHNFYFNKGHKRFAHYRETIDAFDASLYKFNYIFEVRWISSEYSALEKIFKSFKYLHLDLSDLIANENTDGITKTKARGIIRMLEDKNLFKFLSFALDVLYVIKTLSLHFQQTKGGPIGQNIAINNVKNELINRIQNQVGDTARRMYGTFESRFMNEGRGKQNDDGNIRKFSLNERNFWTAEEIEYSTILLKNNLNLGNIDRGDFIGKLIEQIDSYFPFSEFQHFDDFIPDRLPTHSTAATNYAIESVRKISDTYGANSNTVIEQWLQLIQKLPETKTFIDFRKSDPITFWGKVLADRNLPWHPEIKMFVRSLLVLPIGSADAERGFSIFNHIKYDRRSLLKQETLDAILRIRINGPTISEFNSIKFARLWESEGHVLSDSKFTVRHPTHELEEDSENEDDNLYFITKSEKYLDRSQIF